MSAKNAANQLARECIVTALLQLLKEKPLSALSISEITSRAGVSRMTYYRNYKSKEDINNAVIIASTNNAFIVVSIFVLLFILSPSILYLDYTTLYIYLTIKRCISTSYNYLINL